MIEFKYIYKLVEANKAKEQGGFFNRIFVKLVRKSLRKRLEKLKGDNIPKNELEFYTKEILNL